MKRSRELSRQIVASPKLKYWLCAGGVIIVMSVLAAIPPLSQNNLAGTKPAAAAKRISSNGLSLSGERPYIQTASAAGQGSMAAVQGPMPAATLSATQDASIPKVNIGLPVIPPHLPCAVCGGFRIMCPDVAAGCSRCLGPLGYACLIE